MSKNEHIVMPEDHMDELYNSGNPLVKHAHNARLDEIVKNLLALKISNARVLDAGCGEGHLIERIYKRDRKNKYYGLDVTPVAIEAAQERCPYAEHKLGDLINTGYENEYYDVILSTEVIEHIIEFEKVFNEMKRILKPGGYIILTFPNETLWTISRFLLRRKPVKVPDHVNSFTPKSIKGYVGLDVVNAKGLPYGLPFFASLGYLVVFRKAKN